MQLEVNVAQFAQGAMGADLGGAHGAFENAGDLGEREFLEPRQQEHLPVVAIQPRERRVQERMVVMDGGVFSGVGRLVGVFLQVAGIGGVRSRVGFAEVVGGAAARKVIHPGGEAAIVAVGVAVFEHPLKDGLRDVLRRGVVARQLHQKPEERAVVALEQFAERVEFAVADGEHERVISALFGRGFHGRADSGAASGGATWMNGDFFENGNHGDEGTWLVLPGETGWRGKGYRLFAPAFPVRAGSFLQKLAFISADKWLDVLA